MFNVLFIAQLVGNQIETNILSSHEFKFPFSDILGDKLFILPADKGMVPNFIK